MVASKLPALTAHPIHYTLALRKQAHELKGDQGMQYLHYPITASADAVVEVTLDKQANVRLLDQSNYDRYRSGQEHRYYGGLAKISPMRLSVPHAGDWHVVIDLGGYAGKVRASVRVVG
jgi:Domain of unknown function (DUF1883)